MGMEKRILDFSGKFSKNLAKQNNPNGPKCYGAICPGAFGTFVGQEQLLEGHSEEGRKQASWANSMIPFGQLASLAFGESEEQLAK